MVTAADVVTLACAAALFAGALLVFWAINARMPGGESE